MTGWSCLLVVYVHFASIYVVWATHDRELLRCTVMAHTDFEYLTTLSIVTVIGIGTQYQHDHIPTNTDPEWIVYVSAFFHSCVFAVALLLIVNCLVALYVMSRLNRTDRSRRYVQVVNIAAVILLISLICDRYFKNAIHWLQLNSSASSSTTQTKEILYVVSIIPITTVLLLFLGDLIGTYCLLSETHPYTKVNTHTTHLPERGPTHLPYLHGSTWIHCSVLQGNSTTHATPHKPSWLLLCSKTQTCHFGLACD